MMVGKFPGSTIILAGCDTTTNPSLAMSFLRRGAAEVVGWDGEVQASSNDVVILNILKETLENNVELSKTVELYMENLSKSKKNSPTLQYYSASDLDI